MRDPIRLTMQRGASTLLRAMQNGDEGKYAMTETIVGEPTHAAIIAATNENPALLRSVLRLIKKHAPKRPPSSGDARKETDRG